MVDWRSVMFCPKCKSEYREEFTHCSDCDVDLVVGLPKEGTGPAGIADPNLQEMWSGAGQHTCVAICERLKAAKIAYFVTQRGEQFQQTADWFYSIAVPSEYFDHAKELVETDNTGSWFETDSGEEAEAQLDAADEDWNTLDWNPDEATARLWSGKNPASAMIETSLVENEIHFRMDIAADRTRTIFVTPHDEARAKEIVKEIESGEPLTDDGEPFGTDEDASDAETIS
jgi:hypothetical protein